jgi:hypothetical protein
MKFNNMLYIVFAIPGTFIEIRVNIVRKERSFNKLQRYWMKTESARFTTTVPGRKAVYIIVAVFARLAVN